MAEDDIVQRVIITATDEATPVLQRAAANAQASAQKIGASFQQLGQQLGQTTFAQFGQKIEQAGSVATAAIGKVAQAVPLIGASFAEATKSIAALGTTVAQALETARAAAQKFGASAKDLAGVENVIRALGARSRDSSTSFTQLAQNFDQARNSGKTAGAGIAEVAQGAATATTGMRGLRAELGAVSSIMTSMGGGPVASLAGAFGRLGLVANPVVLALAAIGAASVAMDAASVSAAKTADAIEKLAKQAGDSRENVGQLVQALRNLGVSSEQSLSQLGAMFSKIRQQSASVADELARAADKMAAAKDKVESAKLNLESVKLGREELAIKQDELNAAFRKLAINREENKLRREELALQGQQLATQGRQIALQLSNLNQTQSFERRGLEINIEDLELRGRALQLQKDLMTGKISQEEFDRKMAGINLANINQQIKANQLAKDQAANQQSQLKVKQQIEKETLEQQKLANELAQKRLALDEKKLNESDKDLDREERKLNLQQKQLDIEKQQQGLKERQAERDVTGAEQDLLVARANDLQTVMDKIKRALSGEDVKFDVLTTVETQTKALLKVLGDLPGGVKEKMDALRQVLEHAEGGPDLLKAIGLGPEFQTALDRGVEAFNQAMEKVKSGAQIPFDELKKTGAAFDNFVGTFQNLKDAVGGFNASDATQHLNTLTSALDTAEASAKGLKKALDAIGGGGEGGKDPMGSFVTKLLSGDLSGGLGGGDISGGLADKFKGLLKVIGDFFSVGKAGAAELKDGLNKVGDEAKDAESPVDNLAKAAEKIGDMAQSAQNLVEALGNIKGAAEEAQQALSKMLGGGEGEGKEGGGDLASKLKEQIDSVIQTIQDAGQTIADALSELASSLASSLEQMFSASVQAISDYVQKILELVKEAADAVKSLNDLVESGGAAAGASTSALASGGLFMGRHGGIDSNLAWLTSGEFVMSVNAVRHWGVDFLHMINSMQMPRFAAGGMVGGAMATSAAARTASSHISMAANQGASRMLSLVIEGKTFSGLSVPEKTAVALERFAVTSQLASAGRKPNWKR